MVSFLWADAAGNEVLLDSDRSQTVELRAEFRPFRFRDGWGIGTPTSDADFAGMCKSLASTATTTPGRDHRRAARAP